MCNFVVSLLTNDEPTLFDTHVKCSFCVGVVTAQFELLIDVLLRCCASNSARNSASNSASNVQFIMTIFWFNLKHVSGKSELYACPCEMFITGKIVSTHFVGREGLRSLRLIPLPWCSFAASGWIEPGSVWTWAQFRSATFPAFGKSTRAAPCAPSCT